MGRRPLAPEVWEQALVNGRRIHPSDTEAATAWAERWYGEQGGRFAGEIEPSAPEPDPLMPVENTMSDEAFEALMLNSDHAPGPEPEEAKDPEPELIAAPVPPKPASRGRKRARNGEGEYKGDNPETPDVNEAWVAD